MQTANNYEKEIWLANKVCVGIDEAGRGPIAGPLVVAGVVFPKDYDSKDIYDSKKLSAKKRAELFEVIKKDALFYQIIIVPIEEIDQLNIYQATKKAMNSIALNSGCEEVLTDAMPLNNNLHVVDIIKGDQKSCSIAAGSILAKVTRDRIMDKFDEIYPQYGFIHHKGYPTKEHLLALEQYGILPIHRRTYNPVARMLQYHLDI